jgi:maltooligosyltrehalose trehalohydrolase
LTGERHGLYKDFGTLPALGKVVKDNLFLDGIYSQFRCRRHGAPASHLPSHKFIAFNQNHDFIGNRVNGDRFAATSPIDKQKCALSLLLLSPFVPLIFMGEEYGEIAPFHYFVDHQDPDLIEQVRAGRIRDLRQFWSSPRPQDPHTPETFNASRLMLGRRHTPAGQALLSLVKDLIDVRRSFPQALSLANRDVRIDDSRSVFCLDYEFNNQAKFKLAANFGRQRIPLSGIVDSSWQLELSTAWEQYSVAPTKPKDDTSLMPLTAEVYRAK